MASPIHVAATAIWRYRTCPRCGRRQTVPLILSHENVTCRRCGTLIPPPPESAPHPGAKAAKK